MLEEAKRILLIYANLFYADSFYANGIRELRESCRNSVITKVAFEMFLARGWRYPLAEDCAVSSSMVRTFITSIRKMGTWIPRITFTSTAISLPIIRVVSILRLNRPWFTVIYKSSQESCHILLLIIHKAGEGEQSQEKNDVANGRSFKTSHTAIKSRDDHYLERMYDIFLILTRDQRDS